ncbi:MAG: hypothetical protein WCL44_15990, partial [bacterium]
MTGLFHSGRLFLACVLLIAGAPLCSLADVQAEIKAEADFASGLVDLRFPDLAQKVVDKLASTYGSTGKAEESRIRIKIMTSTGDFKAAKELVSKMPPDSMETMAMKLTLADQLYNWGKVSDSKELYEAFFMRYPSGPPDELQRFYGDSAYRYAQMLKRVSDYS